MTYFRPLLNRVRKTGEKKSLQLVALPTSCYSKLYRSTHGVNKKPKYYFRGEMNRDSSVGIATGYGLDDRMVGVRYPEGAGNFSQQHVQTGSGAHQISIQWVPRALSLGLKRPGRESDHSPPFSAEVKECVEL
jgi:hypothetical protein